MKLTHTDMNATGTIEQATALAVNPPPTESPCTHAFKPIFCDSCGRSMQDEKGANYIGVQFKATDIPAALLAPYRSDVTYSVCWACWMKSLGIKP